MVVDRNKFKDMVSKSAKEIAAKTTEQSVRRMEETVKEVTVQSAAEIGSLLTLISGVIQTEQESIKQNMKAVWDETEANKGEEGSMIERRKQALDKALEAQKSTLQRIFDLVIAKKSQLQHFNASRDSDTQPDDEEGSAASSSS